jgi:hypothetical protein
MRVGKCFKSILSTNLQGFALAAAGTGQRQAQFAGRFVKVAGEAKTIRPALEAFHVEAPEGLSRGVRGGSIQFCRKNLPPPMPSRESRPRPAMLIDGCETKFFKSSFLSLFFAVRT